jgi:hypothetical protein
MVEKWAALMAVHWVMLVDWMVALMVEKKVVLKVDHLGMLVCL